MRSSTVTWSLAVVMLGMLIAATNGFRIESITERLRKRTDDTVDTAIPIQKRYTEYQNNAIAYCTGSCMYKARLLYGDCYDLCNWNGRAPSPWQGFFQGHGRSKVKAEQQSVATSKSKSNNLWSVLANRSGRQKSLPWKPSSGRQKSLPWKPSSGGERRTASSSPPVDGGKKKQTKNGLRAIMGRKKGSSSHKKDCT